MMHWTLQFTGTQFFDLYSWNEIVQSQKSSSPPCDVRYSSEEMSWNIALRYDAFEGHEGSMLNPVLTIGFYTFWVDKWTCIAAWQLVRTKFMYDHNVWMS